MAKHPSSNQGPKQRQLRVGELIRRTLSDILNRGEIHDPELNAMSITVGEVTVSPDFKVATIYVMPLMGKAPVAEAVKLLARHKGELRHRIGSQVTLRFAPELRFRPDETFDRMDETRRLFADPRVQRDIAAGQAEQAEPEANDEDEA